MLLGLEPAPAAPILGGAREDRGDDPAARVEAYVRARDRFFEGQIALAEQRTGDALDRYVESVEASADFDAGYHQVLTLANVATDVPRERRLEAVQALARLRPGLGDLRRLQRQLR